MRMERHHRLLVGLAIVMFGAGISLMAQHVRLKDGFVKVSSAPSGSCTSAAPGQIVVGGVDDGKKYACVSDNWALLAAGTGNMIGPGAQAARSLLSCADTACFNINANNTRDSWVATSALNGSIQLRSPIQGLECLADPDLDGTVEPGRCKIGSANFPMDYVYTTAAALNFDSAIGIGDGCDTNAQEGVVCYDPTDKAPYFGNGTTAVAFGDVKTGGNHTFTGNNTFNEDIVLQGPNPTKNSPSESVRWDYTEPYVTSGRLFNANAISPDDCNSDGTNDADHVIGVCYGCDAAGNKDASGSHMSRVQIEGSWCPAAPDVLAEWNWKVTDADGTSWTPYLGFCAGMQAGGTPVCEHLWRTTPTDTGTLLVDSTGNVAINYAGEPLALLDIREKSTGSASVGLVMTASGALNGGFRFEYGTVSDGEHTDLYAESLGGAYTQTFRLPDLGGGTFPVNTSGDGQAHRTYCDLVSAGDPGVGSEGDTITQTTGRSWGATSMACSASMHNITTWGGGWLLEGCNYTGDSNVRCVTHCIDSGGCTDVSSRSVRVCCTSDE